MTPAERRERARLRSERYRRAHGVMPRRPAQRPWLAEGVSRSTWYRRRKQARERAALLAQQATFERAESFAMALARDLRANSGVAAGPLRTTVSSEGSRSGRTPISARSEERREGKECRSRWSPYH